MKVSGIESGAATKIAKRPPFKSHARVQPRYGSGYARRAPRGSLCLRIEVRGQYLPGDVGSFHNSRAL